VPNSRRRPAPDDPLGQLLRAAIRQAADPDLKSWLKGLLTSGEQAEGVVSSRKEIAGARAPAKTDATSP